MKFKIVYLLAIAFIVVGTCNGAPLNTDEEEARKFVQEFSRKVNTISDHLAKVTFSDKVQDYEAYREKFDLVLSSSASIVSLVNESKKFDTANFEDEELKRIFAIIRKFAKDDIVGSDRYMGTISSVNTLESLASDKDIVSYKDENVRLAYVPDVENILANSKDPDELLHYWSTWRSRNAGWAKHSFLMVVSNLQDAANLTEISAYDFWMKDYDLKQMDAVMTHNEIFYYQMHAYIRYKLNKKYGDSVVKLDGPIPDHLFRQVLAQVWAGDSIIDDLFPLKDLPPFDSILKQKGFDTLKMFRMADEFYQSLGFEAIPDNHWGTRLRMKSSEDEGDCEPLIFDYTSDVYMDYCQKMDFRKFLSAHGYMGQLYYAREQADLPAYYFDSYDFEFAVGKAVTLAASTAKHLKRIGLVDSFNDIDEFQTNRLLRLSIKTILNLPMYYVHNRVMADLFAGAVELTDLNKHYWKLMDQYAGIGPPLDRSPDGFDFPYDFYTDLNENPHARKFYSEILGYQFFKKMCSISEQYPKDSLFDCDFYGNKEVGDALKKMMKLGSSKPFEKVLGTFMPEEPYFSPRSLMEYYLPVVLWLNEENRRANVTFGWTHLDKNIASVKLPSDSDEVE